jgi:hypothetical protein
MAQSPWFSLTQQNPNEGTGPLSNEALIAMLMPEETITGAPARPAVSTKKAIKDDNHAQRKTASEGLGAPKAKTPWELLQDQLISDFDTRKSDLGALESRISALPENDPSSFKNMNLKPLLALADTYGGTNFAASYEKPKIDESLRNKLNEQAEKKRQALADDQLKLAASFKKSDEFDRSLSQKVDFTRQFFDAKDEALEVARTRAGKVKDPTANAFEAGGFARRLEQTDEILNGLSAQGYLGPSRSDQAREYLPNEMRNPNAQKYDQAVRNFINATLRRESGASISPQEFDNARKQYLPQPGDDAGVLANKAANRRQVLENFKAEGGNAYGKIPYISPSGGVHASKPKTIVQDGHTYTLNEATGQYE